MSWHRATWRFRVQRIAETGSTNADLLDAARRGEPEGLVLVADHQTQGRGRLDRRWEAPPGSALLMSILFRPRDALHLVPEAVALAARSACQRVAGVEPQLKWPNDLLVDERKLAGILSETVAGPGAERAVVCGLGLNLWWEESPPALSASAVTLAEAAGRRVARDELLAALLDELGRTDLTSVHERYRDALATLGRAVRVELPSGDVVIGTAGALDDDGALLVTSDSGGDARHTVRVAAGDVVHLRHEPRGA